MKLLSSLKKAFSSKVIQLLTISTASVSVGACEYGVLDDLHSDTSCCEDNEAYETIYEFACELGNTRVARCDKANGDSIAQGILNCCDRFDTSGRREINYNHNKEYYFCAEQVAYSVGSIKSE